MPREQQAGERHLYNLDFVWRTAQMRFDLSETFAGIRKSPPSRHKYFRLGGRAHTCIGDFPLASITELQRVCWDESPRFCYKSLDLLDLRFKLIDVKRIS
jgi:hypothetical protein